MFHIGTYSINLEKTKTSFKKINQLAIPAILSGISESVISLTDLAIIGHVQKDPVEAMAAVGLVGSFLSAIIWVIAQTKTAISTQVSQHLGNQRLHAVKTLVPQAIVFNFLLSLCILGITVAFATPIFSAYNARGLILEYTIDYYLIRAFGFPFTLVSFALYGVFRGLQNTSWAMRCALTGALLHVVLAILLVFGIPGFLPAMHIQGAAIASLISQILMCGMALFYFFTKTPFSLKISRTLNHNLKPFILLSFNFIIRTCALNVAIYLGNAYATGYGSTYIAAQSILMNIWLFFSFFIDGYSNAGNALAGKLSGENNYTGLWEMSKQIRKHALFVSLLLVAVCFLLYSPIGRMFNKDYEVLEVFKSVFWIILCMQPINALAYVYDGIYKGLGEAKFLRNNLLAATFLGFIPTLLITDALGYKLYGIWIAFGVWMFIRSFPLIWKLKIQVQQHTPN